MRYALLGLALLAGGCVRHADCRPGTLLVALDLDAASRSADTLVVDVAIAGGAPRETSIPVAGLRSSVNLEVDFSSYPAGAVVAVSVRAEHAAQVLGAGSASTTLRAGCATLAVAVGATGLDLAAPEDGGDDACAPMFTVCPAAACGTISDGCGRTLACAAPCQLDAITPPLAPAGQTIYLEGRFSVDATVDFPGAPGVAATVLGPARASVVVPAGAGVGALTVETGGTTTRALAFRRPSFALGPQLFQQQYEQADYARAMPVLNTARSGAAVVADGSHVYVIGGAGNGGPFSSIEQAIINADGTLGAMTTSASALVTGRSDAAALRIGNYLYVIGGNSSDAIVDLSASSALASVERAPIQADGTLGAFTLVQGVQLHTARYGHAAAIVGATLYVIGGVGGNPCDEHEAVSSIERADILPDGTLAPFGQAGAGLISPRSRLGVVAQGGWLYALGGNNGSADLASIEYASIQPDGSLGSFMNLGATLLEPAHAAIAFSIDGKLYALGGASGALEVASVNGDGSLGDFAGVPGGTALGSASYLQPLAGALAGSSLYLFGGGSPSRFCTDEAFGAFVTARVQRVTFDAAAFPEPIYFPAAVSAPAPLAGRARPFAAALGGWVYLMGGQLTPGQPDVERAAVEADGTLGAFAAVDLALTTPRRGLAGAVVGGYVYLAGGVADAAGTDLAGATPLGSVEYAVITADGSLDAAAGFQGASVGGAGAAPVVLSAPRTDFRFVSIGADEETNSGQSLCAVGGTTTGGGALSSIDCAPINPDGTLGSFALVSSYSLPAGVEPAVLVSGTSVFAFPGQGPFDYAGFDATGAITSGPTSVSILGPALTGIFAPAGYAAGGTWLLLGNFFFDGSATSSLVGIALAGTTAEFPGAQLQADLSVPITLGHARGDGAAVNVGNYVYVLAGRDQAGDPVPTDVGELR